MNVGRACLGAVAATFFASAAFLACGGGGNGGADAGPDASADTTTTFDVGTKKDARADVAPAEASRDADKKKDAPVEGGHCSPINGACDIVLQDCPANMQCGLVPDPTKPIGYTTGCVPDQAYQHLPVGSFCCPAANDPCNPGTLCTGALCIGDGGSGGGGGRCSPACCFASAINNCGVSTPEGYPGECTLNEDINGMFAFTACAYLETCTLFEKHCPTGFTCEVQDKSGTSKCIVIDQVGGGGPSGIPAGSPCPMGTANACADGTGCFQFTLPDSGTTNLCEYYCYLPGGSPPFDAGIITAAPGHGGCPAGYTCESAPMILPTWLGICAPP
jgi:hypothetical protein